MKKLYVCLLILAALIVAYNVNTREKPQLDLFGTAPSIAQTPLAPVVEFLTWPGVAALWYLALDPDSPEELFGAFLLSWWCWATAIRVTCYGLGRIFGVVNVKHFYWWLYLTVPWRPIYRIILRFKWWWRQFRYGTKATAAWTSFIAKATMVFKPGDCILVGRLSLAGLGLWQPIGVTGSRHVVVVGASGSGKTRLLMTNLACLPPEASAFVIDCDGQIINSLGRPLERAGHRIINLDPYRLSSFPGASWNAIDELDCAAKRHGVEAVVRYSGVLAEAMIPESNRHQPIFVQMGRGLERSAILYVWLFEPPERRNMIRVRELIARGLPEHVIDPKQDPFEVLLTFMMKAPAMKDDGCGGAITAAIAAGASAIKNGKTKEGDAFRATVLSATAWQDLPEMAAISRKSDFHCEDLKNGNPVVFLCAPVTDIQSQLSGWTRALTMMSLYVFQNIPGQLKVPSSFFLEETPSLGRIEMLESAAPVFRHYGVRLWIITQDIERLKQTYPGCWQSFFGNAECSIWFATDHVDNLTYLSEVLGRETRIELVEGSPLLRLLGLSKVPPRYHVIDRPLLTIDQARELLGKSRSYAIVTRAGLLPMKVKLEFYDKALPVQEYDPDKNHREPLPRRMTRAIIAYFAPQKPPSGPDKKA